MSVDDRINELYALPLDEFTAARNALAKTLSGDTAKRVKALAKPTVVPWAVNQVYWKSRRLYDRLLGSGHALREAQIAALRGKASDVRAAADAHRAIVDEAVAEAMRLAEAAGAKPAAEPLSRMFEALSLAPKHPGEPGRLTDMLQPAGFEALLGVAPAGRTAPHAPPSPAPPRERDAAPTAAPPRAEATGRATKKDRERERAERARQKQQEREARAEEARRAREAAAYERERAAERKRAEQDVARAEHAEAAARADLDRAQDRLSEARRELAAARKALRDLPAM